MVVLDASRRNQRVPRLAGWSLGAGVVATIGANLAHGLGHRPEDVGADECGRGHRCGAQRGDHGKRGIGPVEMPPAACFAFRFRCTGSGSGSACSRLSAMAAY